MKGREKRNNSIEINDDLGRIYGNKCNNLRFKYNKKSYIIHGKAYKRIPHQNLPTNPVLVPILGRVVFDSLRRRSPRVLLLQNKLGHLMMPSLNLSFSPFPSGDLVSRESKKTRKFGMEGGVLLGVGFPTN